MSERHANEPAADSSVDAGDATQVLDLKQHAALMALRAGEEQEGGLERWVVVMFTDLVGSTAYYERHGDVRGREKVLTQNALLFPIIQNAGGVIVKTIGDAIMAYFLGADVALRAAAAMQHALREHNSGCAQADDEIHVRIALNAGLAIAQEGDLHGDVVNVAARIEHHAKADEILLAESVADAGCGWPTTSAGAATFKGKAEPVPLLRLDWRQIAHGEASRPPLGLPERYSVGELWSRGAIGDVYRATDQHSGQDVAIGGMHAFLANDPSARRAFLKAARKMTALTGDGVVQVLDYADDSAPEPYFVSELMLGDGLAKLVASCGPLPPKHAAMCAFRVAEVLYGAHKCGVLHGNLEPGNVLVAPSGQLKVLGFGLGSVAATQIEQGKSPLGTPAFMAPEYVVGGDGDVRSDVYSLAALLYFLLSGKAPYEDAATLRSTVAVRSGGYVPLSQVAPGLPVQLVAIVDRAMAMVPEARFADVPTLAAQLRAYFETAGGDPEHDLPRFFARARSSSERHWQRAIRQLMQVSLPLPYVAGALLLITLLAFWLGRLSVPELSEAPSARAPSAEGSSAMTPSTIAPRAAPFAPAVIEPVAVSKPVPVPDKQSPASSDAAAGP